MRHTLTGPTRHRTSSAPVGALALHVTPDMPRQQPLAGRFGYGIVRQGRPRTLSTWRATSPHPNTIRRIAELLGGHPKPDPVSGQVAVTTATDSLDILLVGPEALTVTWHRATRHTCDGAAQHDEQGARSCTCPQALNQRKANARRGAGCTPRTLLRFQLSPRPDLGMFAFVNGSWAFANDATTVNRRLQLSGKPAVARLWLMRTPYGSANEPTMVVYTRPALTLVKFPARMRRRHQHRRASSAAHKRAEDGPRSLSVARRSHQTDLYR